MLEEPVKLECFFFTFKKEMKDINVSLIDRCTIRTYSLWCFVLILHKDLRQWALFLMCIRMYRLWWFALKVCGVVPPVGFFCFELV